MCADPDAAGAATAVFGPLRIPLKLSRAGKGKIRVHARVLRRTFRGGEPLTLRAVPAKGWRFVRWSGACKGACPTCRAGDRLRAVTRSSALRSSAEKR